MMNNVQQQKDYRTKKKEADNSGIKPPIMDEQGIEPWTTPRGEDLGRNLLREYYTTKPFARNDL
jgi:hypothetical protein